ncbi:VWA domain-containing protein [Steroidobacter sp. S1-65]|uniref:VWA domain-containing protein n=1 Tax=Steroidobacter gossypii TaxID=2805490 RepID=A0ABS1X0L1_9GAMM|nr:vWA domain-containing protein [Steroidobacter gossypii]MBM0106753.1 VWA domain-containing protein [Steroidobacter gossypii]
MSEALTFEHPWLLVLLPLALLPLLRGRRDTLAFPSVAWLPRDRVGQLVGWLWPLFAILAIASSILALAQPGRPQSFVQRTGTGAEILVLLDRSRSMDDRMLPANWREIDPSSLLYHTGRGRKKADVARELLSQFVAQRPDDRFSLMYFSNRPLSVVSFTQHDAVMQAGISAGVTGRGLADTEVGRALVAGIAEFDQRAYSGSRIMLLVSDGGAHLDEETRERIRIGLARNRIALYWMYLRSYNSATLDTTDDRWANAPELALHRFFQSLPTPYRAYQAEVPEDLSRAVAEVGRQQNLPLDFLEQIPRRDYSRHFIAVAAFACAMLLLYRSMLLRSWQ